MFLWKANESCSSQIVAFLVFIADTCISQYYKRFILGFISNYFSKQFKKITIENYYAWYIWIAKVTFLTVLTSLIVAVISTFFGLIIFIVATTHMGRHLTFELINKIKIVCKILKSVYFWAGLFFLYGFGIDVSRTDLPFAKISN